MIQRIQSIYLLLGALAVAALFLVSEVWQNLMAPPAWMQPLITALIIITSLAGLAAIFLYKDRSRQRKMVVVVQGLIIALCLAYYSQLYLADALRYTAPDGGLAVNRVSALLLPILGYILFYLARRAITKDIELVRSMDRLR